MRKILGIPAVERELDVEQTLVKTGRPGSRHHAMRVLEKVLVCVQEMSSLQDCSLIEWSAMEVARLLGLNTKRNEPEGFRHLAIVMGHFSGIYRSYKRRSVAMNVNSNTW